MSSAEEVFLIGCVLLSHGSRLFVLASSEVQEVDGPVSLVVEVLGVVEHQAEVHVGREVLSVEVVVPCSSFWHHEETEEFVGENHLDLLEQGGGVLWRVRLSGHGVSVGVALGEVLLTPVKALAGQFINTERARAGGEAAGGDDASFGIPLRIV